MWSRHIFLRLILEPETIHNLICEAVIFASNIRAEGVVPSYLPLALEPKAVHNLICGAVIFAPNIRAEDDA